MALPVPLILNTFIVNYRNRVWKQEVKLRKCERSVQAEEVIPPADNRIVTISGSITPLE